MVFFNKYPDEVYRFIQDNPTAKPQWLHDKILEKFGFDICRQYLYKMRKHWCFGEKYAHGKSVLSWLQKPDYTERLDKDGYVMVKIGNREIRKHRLVWEHENGKLPDDEVLMFLDVNRQNCDIKNLIPVKRKYLPAIKMCLNGKDGTPKLRKTAILAAKLLVDAKEKGIQIKIGNQSTKPKKDDWKDIVCLHKQGKTAKEIARELKKHVSCVYWTIRRYRLGCYNEYMEE